MNKRANIKKKKLQMRSNVKVALKILGVFFVFFIGAFYFYQLDIKNIYIKGNIYTKDIEIIEKAGVEDYPKLYRLRNKKVKENIESLPLIESVKIKKSIFGKLTLEVKETEILFFYKYNNKYITKNGDSVDIKENVYGYPTLINFTPDTIFDELVKGLSKIDQNIIKMINEIEYNPYKSTEGVIVDATRFTLHMNDLNTVLIDTVNIKKLNEYTKIYASLGMDQNKGTLYLDTITEDNIYFEIYKEKEEIPEEDKVE